jgi:phage shock protein E
MKLKSIIAVFFLSIAATFAGAQKSSEIQNPAIDMNGYIRLVEKAAEHRKKRRLTEEQFIAMSREPGVVVLDARSKEKFDELHIKDAINLSFPDITVESLARVLPDKKATILIYCNNNFRNAEAAFPTKMATASLNLSTYISLYTYGYRNIYELGPLLDAKTTKLELVASPEPASN